MCEKTQLVGVGNMCVVVVTGVAAQGLKHSNERHCVIDAGVDKQRVVTDTVDHDMMMKNFIYPDPSHLGI